MNEDKLIEKYVRPSQSSHVVKGRGDDCSVVEFDSENFLIATTDLLVEHVHFRLPDIRFAQLGYKSLAVNISDINAMGGAPKWAHLTLAIPPKINEVQIAEFFAGFYGLADRFDIQLVGGDMSASRSDLFIDIHLSGLVEKNKIQYRKDFAQSDILCVTGPLGDSAAGLECLLQNRKGELCSELVARHFTPPVENEKTLWLTLQPGVHGMMDLSDGLMTDLKRIPDVGFDLDLDGIPHSSQLTRYCQQFARDIFQFSLAGGEDYVLLFGCKRELLPRLQQGFQQKFAQEFYPIGRIVKNSPTLRYFKNSKQVELNYKTFQHFTA